jgi:hypothetical protein
VVEESTMIRTMWLALSLALLALAVDALFPAVLVLAVAVGLAVEAIATWWQARRPPAG